MDVETSVGKTLLCVPDSYVRAVTAAGGMAVMLPCGLTPDVLRDYLQVLDGFCFVGGRDYPPELFGEQSHPKIRLIHPDRAAADMFLAKQVIDSTLPALGICCGCQLLAIAAGGKIIQHLDTAGAHTGERSHPVRVVEDGIIRQLFGPGPVIVNSAHHQAVRPEHPGKGFRVTALAEDGVVEAVEGTDGRFLLGVQWHPERMDHGTHRQTLFSAFINACK